MEILLKFEGKSMEWLMNIAINFAVDIFSNDNMIFFGFYKRNNRSGAGT